MAKVERLIPKDPEIVITLSMDEAEQLIALVGATAGDELMDLYNALSAAEVSEATYFAELSNGGMLKLKK